MPLPAAVLRRAAPDRRGLEPPRRLHRRERIGSTTATSSAGGVGVRARGRPGAGAIPKKSRGESPGPAPAMPSPRAGNDIVVCKETLGRRLRADRALPTGPTTCASRGRTAKTTTAATPRTNGSSVSVIKRSLRAAWTALLNASDPARHPVRLPAGRVLVWLGRGRAAICGCGGSGKQAAKSKSGPAAKRAPPQCEPTLTCEGYSFAVWKAPKSSERATTGRGARLPSDSSAASNRSSAPSISCRGQVPRDELLQWVPGVSGTPSVISLVQEKFYDHTVTQKFVASNLPVNADLEEIRKGAMDPRRDRREP